MDVMPTAIPGVLIIQPDVFHDDRGYFMESFNPRMMEAIGGAQFVQDNHSHSKKGVLRGLHYQSRNPQGKLVRVVSGSVYDVAVDLRKSSPTFGKWVGTELSRENHRLLWVPPGFAHGFLTLTESADLLYKVTQPYDPADERTLCWDDPDLGVRWPLEGKSPLLSAKDARGKSLREIEAG